MLSLSRQGNRVRSREALGIRGQEALFAIVRSRPTPDLQYQYPALDCTHLVSGHQTSLNSLTFDHANSIQATSIINTHSALIADAIGLHITLPLTLPELVNPLRSLPS